MTVQGKTVSVIDIAKGALGFLPDVPQILPTLANLAFLRPHSRRSLGLLFQETARIQFAIKWRAVCWAWV
jgi:fatty-acyl-CoA synthase